jgi:hypothetical protein
MSSLQLLQAHIGYLLTVPNTSDCGQPIDANFARSYQVFAGSAAIGILGNGPAVPALSEARPTLALSPGCVNNADAVVDRVDTGRRLSLTTTLLQ